MKTTGTRRCPACKVFVPVSQLDLVQEQDYSCLAVDGKTAKYSDRLSLRCQRCFSEVVYAYVYYRFDVEHGGVGHRVAGVPVSREPVSRIEGGRRSYGVKVVCEFLCSCNWSDTYTIEISEFASKFSSL